MKCKLCHRRSAASKRWSDLLLPHVRAACLLQHAVIILCLTVYLSLFAIPLSVILCLCVAYTILSRYNRSTTNQKGCWQENKSTQIPVVYSSFLASHGLAIIPQAQHGLHSAKHGAIGHAMEARCTLTLKEIGSLVLGT